MSSARAQANHSLYLAKIVLAAWRRDLAAREIAAVVLSRAYLPALREHLGTAYGWFLLALCGAEAGLDGPPRNCGGLPDVPVGKAVPGEIREFQQLEEGGWLAQMLASDEAPGERPVSAGNLASAASASPDTQEAGRWIEQLETLFQRMSDSLDEY